MQHALARPPRPVPPSPRTTIFATAALGAALAGCGGGPEYHRVGGRVTLDGEPLEGAVVTFSPEEGTEDGSREASALFLYGTTDADGRFTLHETQDVSGAPVGRYVVRISTYDEGNPGAVPAEPGTPERVPATYNVRSTLTVEVKPGENEFPFELDSAGEIDAGDDESD